MYLLFTRCRLWLFGATHRLHRRNYGNLQSSSLPEVKHHFPALRALVASWVRHLRQAPNELNDSPQKAIAHAPRRRIRNHKSWDDWFGKHPCLAKPYDGSDPGCLVLPRSSLIEACRGMRLEHGVVSMVGGCATSIFLKQPFLSEEER